MKSWGWSGGGDSRAADGAPSWLAPLASAAPWIAAALLFALILVAGGKFTCDEGTLFALPRDGAGDAADTDAVALVMASPRGTLVFFDDTRYMLGDAMQEGRLGAQLSETFKTSAGKTLLALADADSKTRDLMKLAAIARENGVEKILFASQKGGKSGKRADQ